MNDFFSGSNCAQKIAKLLNIFLERGILKLFLIILQSFADL